MIEEDALREKTEIEAFRKVVSGSFAQYDELLRVLGGTDAMLGCFRLSYQEGLFLKVDSYSMDTLAGLGFSLDPISEFHNLVDVLKTQIGTLGTLRLELYSLCMKLKSEINLDYYELKTALGTAGYGASLTYYLNPSYSYFDEALKEWRKTNRDPREIKTTHSLGSFVLC